MADECKMWDAMRAIVENRSFIRHNTHEFGSQQLFTSDINDYKEIMQLDSGHVNYHHYEQIGNGCFLNQYLQPVDNIDM